MAAPKVRHRSPEGDIPGVATETSPRHDGVVRRLVAVTLLLLSLPVIAGAQDTETVRVATPAAPSAVYVDGVKVGSELAMLPKQAPARGRCTSSGCTIIVTY